MGLSVEFCCLAYTCGGVDRGHKLSNSSEKFEAGNALVSGDGRSSRWYIVELSSHRLWYESVMSVREKCDEKSWDAVILGSVESQPSPKCARRAHPTCPPEYSGAQVSAQKTGREPGAPGSSKVKK
jgi:hypothetical protein